MEKFFNRKDLIYTIAQEQSFSKAAQKLFMAQPSLSLMVRTLEEDLGTPLFDRSCKPIRLTEAGQAYVRAAEQIREIEQDFQDYILRLNNMETGSLRIGSNQLLSSLVLPKYITQFTQAYPSIRLTLIDANSTSLENAITTGDLDIVIDNSVLPADAFEQHYLTTERLLLAVPAAFAENEACRAYQLSYQDILDNRHISHKKPVPLDTFAETPFILMNRDNDTRKQTSAIFQEADFSPKVLFELDRLTTLYTYVEQGTAASLVSDTLVRNIRGVDHSKIVFYMLPTRHNQRSIFASYKKNKYCTKAMTTLIENLGGLR
ncbi:MAG: LysR family transcriptional regulator [Oscillospiraceae bacterium]|nr:LysR family transcriptional regulator [Oscillospiraceae bacterium]